MGAKARSKKNTDYPKSLISCHQLYILAGKMLIEAVTVGVKDKHLKESVHLNDKKMYFTLICSLQIVWVLFD